MPKEGLRGLAVPNSLGPRAGGTGSLAQVAVGAYGEPAGDGSSRRPGPTSWGERGSFQGGGWYLWRSWRARKDTSKTARAHQLRGRGTLPWRRVIRMEGQHGSPAPNNPDPPARETEVLPRWRLLPMDGLQATAVPNGPGRPAGGTGSPAQAAVSAYGAPAADGSTQRPRPTSRGDGESYPHGGWCLLMACGGRQLPTA